MIKFTLLISEQQNEKLQEYKKNNYLDNRSQAIRHLIDSTLKKEEGNKNE
jgi:metal-responsive CopG/Arc/MetJ family transcriptional regulator